MAPNRSGRRTSMFPIRRPPLLPPWMPRCAGEVTLRRTRSSPTAMKSSYARYRFALSADWCHLGPNSPPPRMLATT